MKKFLLLYNAKMPAEEQMKGATPEQAKKGMDMWTQWFQKAGSAIIDMGAPLGSDTIVTKTESMAKSGEFVGGYTIVQAETMDAVKTMLTSHPHFMQEGNTIEVLEVLPMPGM